MKIKKIIVLLVVILAVFLIYLTTLDRHVYYLSIGDYITTGIDNEYIWNQSLVQELKQRHKFEVYINQFSDSNLRTTDLIYQIQNNEKKEINGKEKSIKNALIKADLVTLSIGMNDILYKINMDIEDASMEELYNYVDETMEDTNTLLELIREYCKEDILMTNYYVPRNIKSEKADKMISYANKKLQDLSNNYNIKVIDISNLTKKKKYFNNDTAYLSKEGEQKVSDKFKKMMSKTLFK